MKTADCHPERAHRARGLCAPCYMRDRRLREPEKVRAQERASHSAKPEARRASQRRASARHREAHPDAGREYYAANIERVRKYRAARARVRAKQKREWDQANREHLRAYAKARYSLDPQAVLAHFHRRRARLRDGSSPGVTSRAWRDILEVFGHVCAYCIMPHAKLTRDHVVPLARGGRDEPSNVVPACSSCNCRKGARTLLAFVGGQ